MIYVKDKSERRARNECDRNATEYDAILRLMSIWHGLVPIGVVM